VRAAAHEHDVAGLEGELQDRLLGQDGAAEGELVRDEVAEGPTVDEDLAGGRGQLTAEELQQRRLAGAVLSDDGQDLAGGCAPGRRSNRGRGR
jgi:hypothetical protein